MPDIGSSREGTVEISNEIGDLARSGPDCEGRAR